MHFRSDPFNMFNPLIHSHHKFSTAASGLKGFGCAAEFLAKVQTPRAVGCAQQVCLSSIAHNIDNTHTHIYNICIWICVLYCQKLTNIIYSYGSKPLCPWNAILSEATKSFAHLLRTPCLSLAESILSNNSIYEDSFITCQIRTTSSYPCRHPFRLLQTRYCLARLTGPPPSKCNLTLAHSFANLSQKYPHPQNPSHQQGAHQRKSNHKGPWCLALAKHEFRKLDCCIWSLFLETSESNVRQYQRKVQGCVSKTMAFGCSGGNP